MQVAPSEPGGPPPSEPGMPPPNTDMVVPTYDAEPGGLAGSSAWGGGFGLTLCGKRISNEHAKQLFAGMGATSPRS